MSLQAHFNNHMIRSNKLFYAWIWFWNVFLVCNLQIVWKIRRTTKIWGIIIISYLYFKTVKSIWPKFVVPTQGKFKDDQNDENFRIKNSYLYSKCSHLLIEKRLRNYKKNYIVFHIIHLRPNLMNLSRVSNPTKPVLIERRLKSLKMKIWFLVEPTIFEPQLKFKPWHKFFKFGLRLTIRVARIPLRIGHLTKELIKLYPLKHETFCWKKSSWNSMLRSVSVFL